jgi:hypothetical protein
LTTEVKYIIGIVAFVWGIAVPYFWIKEDISLIKQNHLFHIENMSNEIKELSQTQVKQGEIMVKLMWEIARLEK